MDVYSLAMEQFGAIRQLIKLAEECGELAAVSAKLSLEMCEEPQPEQEELQQLTSNLIEEMADVDILIRQFLATPGYRELYNFWYRAKLNRLADMVSYQNNGVGERRPEDYETLLWLHGLSQDTPGPVLWRQVAEIALQLQESIPQPVGPDEMRRIFDDANLKAVKLGVIEGSDDGDRVFFEEMARLVNERMPFLSSEG